MFQCELHHPYSYMTEGYAPLDNIELGCLYKLFNDSSQSAECPWVFVL